MCQFCKSCFGISSRFYYSVQVRAGCIRYLLLYVQLLKEMIELALSVIFGLRQYLIVIVNAGTCMVTDGLRMYLHGHRWINISFCALPGHSNEPAVWIFVLFTKSYTISFY